MQTIKIEGLTRSYGRKPVLTDVNLVLKPGITGLLGPNGAGKTTLMRCVLGVLPCQGTIAWPSRQTSVGYLPQHFHIFQRLTVLEALEYVAVLKRKPKEAANSAMTALHLQTEKDVLVHRLSGGMLRRLGVAQALLGDADVLVLDEPTVGLDPMHRSHLRDLIANIAQDRMVLMSTHIVEDVENIAQSVAILAEGKVLVQDDTQHMVDTLRGKVGTIRIPKNEWPAWSARAKILQSKPEGGDLHLRMLADTLPEGAVAVSPTLEDVYFSYIDNPYVA